MENGNVLNWDPVRGFGFVAPETGGKNVFLHAKTLPIGALVEVGTRVEFEARVGERGPYATAARLIDGR